MKKLLTEAQIRKMMRFANIHKFSDNFLKESPELDSVQEEMEEEEMVMDDEEVMDDEVAVADEEEIAEVPETAEVDVMELVDAIASAITSVTNVPISTAGGTEEVEVDSEEVMDVEDVEDVDVDAEEEVEVDMMEGGADLNDGTEDAPGDKVKTSYGHAKKMEETEELEETGAKRDGESKGDKGKDKKDPEDRDYSGHGMRQGDKSDTDPGDEDDTWRKGGKSKSHPGRLNREGQEFDGIEVLDDEAIVNEVTRRVAARLMAMKKQ